ncbi:AbrB/MazE/SpoVT family DNA-binding domain-containing protein [Serratia marcescens]|uniref:type II toxin-antitoxin system VapB family antitoxin n=1 Tax=Serratia TaxID=613 RepID=UPI0018D777D2|nr:AbrB/MazE/SpoVT family DNA-binding domain-containing protein [Serratia marcescens]MBH3025481.1 AbrB/MazE/SpoVT family DNA-binding domain-containing protein [Serratia marcescens]MBH3040622.1 AbrB/MazE/SpoVT family DNA-binding domain-containing protein [Serratia marcescens]MBH3294097.1 AbrB/MazE/SpoVT family DNA-binding domain-containing protein [Serratia marcescens]HAV6633292.1 AbrB/MazE/SpoVT family DNA-binding domain-containing protein [Serratia marcescens]
MTLGSVFTNNRTQAVRLPAEVRFPDTVSKVTVRVVGKERILALLENIWDSFFCAANEVSDDFLNERAGQHQGEREDF